MSTDVSALSAAVPAAPSIAQQAGADRPATTSAAFEQALMQAAAQMMSGLVLPQIAQALQDDQ